MSDDIWAEPLNATDLGKRLRDLHQRVEQLEALVKAVAWNSPITLDAHLRLAAVGEPKLSNGPRCHPGAYWTCSTPTTAGEGTAVCSACGGRGL